MKITGKALRLLTRLFLLAFFGFSAYAAAPPDAALKSPMGAVSSIGASQDFTWGEVPEATYYRLWVTDSSGALLFKKWFNADSTELSCDGVDCTTTVDVDFSSASFLFWRVRTLNADGLGDWSGKGKFWSMQSRPPAATLVAPFDFVYGPSPNFEWEPVLNATWYKLRLRVPDADPEIIYDQWFRALETCFNAFDCSQVVNPVPGNPTAYEWSVRTYNPAGLGPWAEYVSVELNDQPQIEVSGRYTVTTSGDFSDFTSDCCSFAANGSYAIEIENAGGGSVDITSVMLLEVREQFSLQALDVDDECSSNTSLGAGEKCKIGLGYIDSGIGDVPDDDFGPPDQILVEWGSGNVFFITLESELAQ